MIELLVVIAIIGIMATIVIAAVASARNRANDAKVKTHVNQAKNASEIFFNSAGGYGAPNVSQASGGASCTGQMFVDLPSGMSAYGNSTNYPGGTLLICVENLNAFAFAASLSDAGSYWCVDSSGDPGTITISNPASIVVADDSCLEMDAK